MRSYEEYQWEWLKAIELYEQWKRDDFYMLLERESKAVRYVLHFIWDCLGKVEKAKKDGSNWREFFELAKKYFTWIIPEVKNPNLLKLIVDRFKDFEEDFSEGGA